MSQKNNHLDLLAEIYAFNKRQEQDKKRNRKFTQVVNYQSYIRWCSKTFEREKKFILFSTNLDIICNNGLPKCILKVVEMINRVTFFNKEIRKFVYRATWYKRVFMFYHRYYRYQSAEKLFGKKNFVSARHGHKVHFISYVRRREITGSRTNRNYRISSW